MLKGYSGNISLSSNDIIFSLLFSFLLFLCAVPSFLSIGKLLLQISSTIALASIVSLVAYKIKNGLKIMAMALNIFIVVLVISALVWEAILQIQNITNGGSFSDWIYMFYYDKSMTVGIVCFSVIAVFTLLRLKRNNYNNNSFLKDFTSFFNASSRGFLLYYAVLLFYSFVLIRRIGAYSSLANFIPFNTITGYIRSQNYEMFMYFFGNLLLFTPFGFYAMTIRHKKHFTILLLLPIILSTSIELSQLVLKNGNCDIDDVILNSFGFYLGVLIKIAVDKVIVRKTGGSEKTVFVWQQYSIFSLKVK